MRRAGWIPGLDRLPAPLARTRNGGPERRLERVDLTLEFLTDEKASPRRGGSKGLYPLVRDVVEAGGKDALRSDLARLQVEILRRREERAVIVQELLVASAELVASGVSAMLDLD